QAPRPLQRRLPCRRRRGGRPRRPAPGRHPARTSGRSGGRPPQAGSRGGTDAPAPPGGLAGVSAPHRNKAKGALCLPPVVPDHARTMGLPLDPNRLRTDKEGQVLGLGKGKVQQILARHSISRVLAEEGGRTSRGSLGKMSAYVACLNALAAEGVL